MQPDYIIVGGGAAGSVLAAKLSERGHYNVLLIEAGPDDRHPWVDMPMGMGRLMADPQRSWSHGTTAQYGIPAERWVRGKVLGGSSSINGMVYNRGHPADFEDLARAGCPGWGWETFRDSFRAIEDHVLGPNRSRGAGGPLRVSLPRHSPIHDALIAAGKALGMEAPEDLNDPIPGDPDVIGYMPQSIWRGRRWCASQAFLRQARNRPNLHILTGTEVRRVTIRDHRAVGVECADGRSFVTSAEVILSAGTMGSPKLLQLSGIGPADLLTRHGIPIIHEAPGVGSNLSEHRALYLQFRLQRPELSLNRNLHGARLALSAMRYALSRSGMMGTGPCEAGAFVRATPASKRPDVEMLFMPVSTGGQTSDLSKATFERVPGLSICTFVLRPRSRGSLAITSADPAAPLDIRPNYLSDPEDQAKAVAAVHKARGLASHPSLRGTVLNEVGPAASATSDDEILEAWKHLGGTAYHAAGTCRMGDDAASVVDVHTRVRGVDALRVVDLSLMPFIVSGNTNALTMALANASIEKICGA